MKPMKVSNLDQKQLCVVSMYMTGKTPAVISKGTRISKKEVSAIINSSAAQEYMLEEQDATDRLLKHLYRDGAVTLKECLNDCNPHVKIKAVELLFKVLGKLKPDGHGAGSTVNIQKLMQVINAPVTQAEIDEVLKVCGGDNTGKVLQSGGDGPDAERKDKKLH